jgi:Protein of unknown function (DUF3455)
MIARIIHTLAPAIVAAAACHGTGAIAQVPTAVAAPGETTVATFQGEGAQIYQCKAGNDGKLTWVFREPIATLILDDKTVGRHYAGPTWEDVNGSTVTGKVIGSAPGATANDIPWLKLDVVNRRGGGTLAGVSTVQRLDTHGGVLQGTCDHAGDFASVPYSATYVFLRKGG